MTLLASARIGVGKLLLRGASGLLAARPPQPASGLADSLSRVLRPQAAYRWMLPSVAAITPQYIEACLRGALAGNHVQAWELFDLMLDTWPELASVTNELTEGVLARRVLFAPAADEGEEPSDDAQQRCRVASAALKRMRPLADADENDFDGTVRDIMSAWFLGQVVLELNWDTGDGATLNQVTAKDGLVTAPRSTSWVHPVCYAWNMEGRLGLRKELNALRSETQNARGQTPSARSGSAWSFSTYQPRPSDVDAFPADKFLIGVHKAKSGTALGGAMLRPLAWWWCAANFSSDWLLNLAQLFGIPFRWVNYDPNLPDAAKAELDAMLQSVGSSGWARFPTGTEMKFLEAGKSADASPQDALLDRCDRYARMLVLGQTMSGSQDASKGGGKAFGSVEADVKTQRVDAACKFVAGVLNNQLIPAVLRQNFGDDTLAPSVSFTPDETGGLEDAQTIATLAGAGVKIGQAYVHTLFDIPMPKDGEDIIGAAAQPAPGRAGSPLPAADGAHGVTRPTDEAEPVEARDGFVTIDGHVVFVGPDKDETNQESVKDYVARKNAEATSRGDSPDRIERGWNNQFHMAHQSFKDGKITPKEFARFRAIYEHATGKKAATALHSRDASALDSRPSTLDLASALHETLLPVLKRLEAIAKVDDAAIQQHLVEKLLKDFPALSDALRADQTLAKQLHPTLEHSLLTGLQGKAALAAGDVSGHEFHGNQHTGGQGGADLAQAKAKVRDFLDKKADEVAFAKVDPSVAAQIKDITGKDVSGYQHLLHKDGLIHISKQHGVGREDQVDHLPITRDDIERIPEIVSRPDKVEDAGTDPRGRKIKYTKRFNGTTSYVEQILREDQVLSTKTMWKNKSPGQRATPEGGGAQTSKTSGGGNKP